MRNVDLPFWRSYMAVCVTVFAGFHQPIRGQTTASESQINGIPTFYTHVLAEEASFARKPCDRTFYLNQGEDFFRALFRCHTGQPASARRYSEILVVPNFVTQMLHLWIPDSLVGARIQIHDQDGQLWQETEASSVQMVVGMYALPRGTYNLLLFDQDRLCQGTFTKL